MKRFRFITLMILMLAVAVSTANSRVSISIEPAGANPAPGQTFYLIINTTNVGATPSPVNDMPGCKVLFPLQQRKMSTSTTIVNGQATSVSSASYAVTLRAETPGNYSFGPISVGGVRSNKVSYRITNSGTASPQGGAAAPQSGPTLTSGGDGNLFLRASVSNNAPYEQQGVEYVVRLFTSYTSIFDWTAAASPKFDNCTYDASDAVSRSLSLTDYDGKAYESAIIARYIIYPTKSGQATIRGNEYTGSVAQRYTYQDPMFGTMSRVQPKQISASPNDIVLNVRPLPPHDGIVSGVGDFKVSAQLVSKSFKAHQAATVRYVISGTGNLGFLSLPDLKEIYPAEIKFLKSEDVMKKTVGASSVSGSVTFDCTVIPQRAGNFTIPKVKFLFFNPISGQYYTLETTEFNIVVEEGDNTRAESEILVFNDALQPFGTLSKKFVPMIYNPLTCLYYVLPVLLLIAIAIIYRKHMNRLADVAGTRMRRACREARKRLRRAAEAMRKHHPEAFYEEMLRALWGYIADKLKMPTSELSRDNVSERMATAGVKSDIIDDTIRLIDECEMAKYGALSASDMPAVYDKGCSLINLIEREMATSEKLKSNSIQNP